MLGLECLAVAIFFEARDQPIDGQYAVAEVVMNRVNSDRWPDDVCSVVYQNKQFSFTHDGKSDKIEDYALNDIIEWRAMKQARTVAEDVFMRGYTEITSTHYHTAEIEPVWAKYYPVDGQIGDHIFYTAPVGK